MSILQNIAGAFTFIHHNQTLSLLPERALFWQEQQMLIVADIHLGKAQTFQRAGIPIPGQSLHHDLQRLTQLITQTQAKSLLILGDFVHHRSGLTAQVRHTINIWCQSQAAKIIVILGNHDKPNKAFLHELPIAVVEHYYQAPFAFTHDAIDGNEGFVFMGHLHPVVSFRQSNLRLPAFAFYQQYCVLPAFSLFTGGEAVARKGLRDLFAVAGHNVVPIHRPQSAQISNK